VGLPRATVVMHQFCKNFVGGNHGDFVVVSWWHANGLGST
jgi:hypothetical protein